MLKAHLKPRNFQFFPRMVSVEINSNIPFILKLKFRYTVQQAATFRKHFPTQQTKFINSFEKGLTFDTFVINLCLQII